MSKILKEFIIFLLLAIVIMILLLVAFYEYNLKLTIPEVEKYSRTEQTTNTIQEINTSEEADSTKKDILKSYTVSAYDLEAYKILDIYQDARPDPFSPLMIYAEYDTSISGSTSEVIKKNGGTNNKNTNSTGYFSTSSKTK